MPLVTVHKKNFLSYIECQICRKKCYIITEAPLLRPLYSPKTPLKWWSNGVDSSNKSMDYA